MRGTQVAAFVGALIAFAIFTHARALAIVEYCGATANLTPVGVADGNPATMYALTLWANSARTVSGHIAVQTDSGWFDIPFAGVDLTSRARRYQGPSSVFTRTDFESPKLVATFSSPEIVRAAFVDQATVTNEHTLGWDSQPHACAGFAYDPKRPDHVLPKGVVDLDADPRPTPPPPATPVLHAVVASAPGSMNCDRPFVDATPIKAMPPDFPIGYHIDQEYTSLVEIAVGANGSLDDAWIYAPSGIKALDDASLRAARLTKFDAPRAFCQNVPGVYIFRSVFRP